MCNYTIIGGGLAGLSCAYKLLQMEINPKSINIIEARQEIGSPTRSPGISLNTENFNMLANNIKFQPLTKLCYNQNYITFRREWFEKSILIYLTKLGCNIELKKTVKNNFRSFLNDNVIINCAGNKLKSSGFPGDYTDFSRLVNVLNLEKNLETVPWYGYLTINPVVTQNSDDIFSIHKEGDYFETWTRSNSYEEITKLGLIEIMKSNFPSGIKNIFANNTIDRGFTLANKAKNIR